MEKTLVAGRLNILLRICSGIVFLQKELDFYQWICSNIYFGVAPGNDQNQKSEGELIDALF